MNINISNFLNFIDTSDLILNTKTQRAYVRKNAVIFTRMILECIKDILVFNNILLY